MIDRGVLAGAAGIVVLDGVSYLDELIRARPSSELPSQVVQKLAAIVGLSALASEEGDAPKNRRSGAGPLMGYGVGLGSAVVHATIRPATRWLPWPLAGILLGGATLVVSEGLATRLGATDWGTWTPAQWLSDIIPRTFYGLTVAYVYERLIVGE
ncbi:MAG: hypothetical protein M3R44_08330 [Candidatus Eremiobacteraeota bacterium]|nr:hypothetical protein [Candidatus Eremiobacteraeota bacterium]